MSLLMGQLGGAAVKVKRSQDGFYSKTVILLKKNDCQRSKDKVYIPNTIEMAKIKKPNTGQYKTKVQFSKEMSEEMVRQKLQETFTTFNLNGRVSCAAVSQDSITFQFYGTPRIWNGKTIKERIKGNSVLYIVMEDDQEPNSENGTSSNTYQGDDDDNDMSCIATDVNQMSLLDGSQMEIDDSQQVTPGDGNSNIQQDQLQMSDSSEEGSSSADTSTTSGISGSEHDCTKEELSWVRWWQENLYFEVNIRPNKSPPEGGDPFCLTFNPKLHPPVTSGRAMFGNVGPVKLERSKDGSLFGTNIPASPVLGWVPVIVESQDGICLGQTAIYYEDQVEDILQEIVVNPSLQKRLFDKYNKYHNLGGNLETSGVEAQNYGTLGFKQPVQMLSLLVYAAAEIDALQFIELIFTSSAGRVVFDAYKNNSTLPEVVARDHGNKQTANYLKDVNKRFSEEIRSGKECPHAIDWSELAKAAEAAQKQHEISGHEENCQTERDFPKETGYSGDVDTSSSESSEQTSSDSEDDISRKAPVFPEDVGTEVKNVTDVNTQVEDVGSDVKHVKTEVTDVKTQVEDVGSDVKTDVTDVKTRTEDVGSDVRNRDFKGQFQDKVSKELKDICPSLGSEQGRNQVETGSYLLKTTSFGELSEAEKQQDRKDLEDLQVKMRKALSKMSDTAKSHRAAADYLDTVWMKYKKVHATGSSAGVLGGWLTITAGIATIATAGATVPLLLAGAGVGMGVAGAGSKWYASFKEEAINSSESKKAEKDLQETSDSINEVQHTVKKWLNEKDKTRLWYICYLADQTLKFSDPAVIAILQKEVLPTLELKTQLESAQKSVARWAAAHVATTAASAQVVGRLTPGFLRLFAGAAAGKIIAGVGAACMVWDAVDLRNTIQDIVQNKGSDAAPFLRQKADELDKAIISSYISAQQGLVYRGLES